MSFQITSQNIELLSDHHTLQASAQREDSSWDVSQINLNNYIGNLNGYFAWGEQNYSLSARNVYIETRGDGIWLVATLEKIDGSWSEPQGINLSHKIANINGRLEYQA